MTRVGRLSPIGVCFLIAAKILELKSFSVLLGQLGMYFITVLTGILLHGFVVLVLIYILIVRELPFRYIANISQPLATAFGTSSRSAPPRPTSGPGQTGRLVISTRRP